TALLFAPSSLSSRNSSAFSSFFFHAEDGIRAKLVTGVQTCALPISVGMGIVFVTWLVAVSSTAIALSPNRPMYAFGAAAAAYWEIGRASCRERGRDAHWEALHGSTGSVG